jgi:putative selenate reductase
MLKVKDGFQDEVQIVHLDAFCNECGNCATFCPWDGRPYRDKLTVFAGEEDFRDSTNPGFFFNGTKGMIRIGDRVGELTVDAVGTLLGSMDAGVAAAVRAIVRDYPFLLGGGT